MKLLIVDRGYVDGKFITYLKKLYNVDVLCPLRRNMDQYTDAIALSKLPDARWVPIDKPRRSASAGSRITRACTIDNISLWSECNVPLYTTVVEVEEPTEDELGFELRQFVLCSTRKFDSPHAVIDSYGLRPAAEECFRQFKTAWRIGDFPSPHRSLLEAHVGFTLLTYSLLQLYLMQEGLQKKTHAHITRLKREEHNLEQPVVVYAGDYFAQFENMALWKLALNLPKEVQQKLIQSIDASPHQF